MKAKNTSDLPLAGIRVLDLGIFIAAPFAATVLGEFGAEVIKIEKPTLGDPLRDFGTPSNREDTLCWLSEARNKRSITLDLKSPKGAELLLRLVKQADVVCESFRPGVMESWGLGFDRLLEENPNLVMLRVSGFGQTGPLSQRPGFARIAHAFGGLTHLTGMPGGPPLTPGSTSLADYISGLYGAIGILIALRAREKTGGQYIDLALYESIFRILDDIAPTYAQDGTVRDRLGTETSNACPHGHFQCGDGHWISLACSSDKIFSRLAHLMGQPELADANRYGRVEQRLANRAEVNIIVEDWIGKHTLDQVIALCAQGDVPCAAVQTIADIFQNEQFAARENLLSIDDPDAGECIVPNVIPRLSKTPGSIRHLGPVLGEANESVYNELLGLSAEEIRALKQEGII